jgi:RNA polymerase sigma-54 factor
MALGAKLLQKLNQSLLMTPQLQQAIKLLQLGRVEYLEAIEQELLENPTLEELARDDADEHVISNSPQSEGETEIYEVSADLSSSNLEVQQEPKTESDWENFIDSYSDYQGAALAKGSQPQEDKPEYEVASPNSETLAEYLISQIRFADIDQDVKRIACFIIGNLDHNGYLSCSEADMLIQSGSEPKVFKKALDFVRSLEPCGIGAIDLQQCLLLQLEFSGLVDSLAAKIVSKHLDKLEKKKLDLIAKEEKVSIEQVKQAIEAVRKLEPFPGRNFSSDTARYVTPDVYVQKVQGEWVLNLNEEGLPKLRVNPYYLALLKKEANESNVDKEYIQDRLKAAAWLIKSDMQRRQTILKVADSIVKFQRAFLEHGISKLKPLVLKDVADDIGMHESTVSRITANKYIHTPQGVFELKFFFTSGIKTSSGDVSASAIKDRIKTIISSEIASKPVSDQEIVEMLARENVQIARRTVAKYRETLGIEPSSQRKRAF